MQENVSNVDQAKRFVKKHQAKIMTGALVILAVKHRHLRNDFKELAKATKNLADLTADGFDLINSDLNELYGGRFDDRMLMSELGEEILKLKLRP